MLVGRRAVRWLLAGALVFGTVASLPPASAGADPLPPGFQDQVVFAGLVRPTNIEFSPDGRVFVAEQGGRIMVYDDISDPTPTKFADLSGEVMSQWDRGLLGMALAPNFPTNPYIYVSYTYDAPPGQTAPVWNDGCAEPTGGSCVVTSRISRLTASGNLMVEGSEVVLVHDWCQQFPSHSIGDLKFGADGALYATGGDGASFAAKDYGNLGNPANPCGDPVEEGGSLRSQDLLTTGDPTSLDGALLRLNPATGLAAAGNPLGASTDPGAARIVADGFRNPLRFTMRPGTSEVWVGDVGNSQIEEINRVVSPTAKVTNFGWPCYEGNLQPGTFSERPMCTGLYNGAGQTPSYFNWSHGSTTIPNDTCPSGGSSITGLAFYPNSDVYPAQYHGALFFADYTRRCIWAMKPSTPGGLPDKNNVETFVANAANPVDLQVGPGDELYYVDLGGGTVRRIRYYSGNQPPTAVISAAPTGGALPLKVTFNGAGSVDPDAADVGRLTYAWDFGDGTPGSTAATVTHTYADQGSYTASLTVTDTLGSANTTTTLITPGNDAPTAVLDTPVAATTWRVGDVISFSGHATDLQDGTLDASRLAWHLRMMHCYAPGNCHVHNLQDWTGVSGGSYIAPDHELPSYMELELVATDSKGLKSTVVRRLDPKSVDLTFVSTPPGLTLSIGDYTGPAPFTRKVIQGSTVTVTGDTPQLNGKTGYRFATWSDSGAQTHIVTAPTTATTYNATYNVSTLTNQAVNKPATGSTPCGDTESAAKAFNGTWAGGSADKFCSKVAPQWIQVDLGTSTNIFGFVVHHAGGSGETPLWNTKTFNIQVSPNGTTWTTVVAVASNTDNITTHPVATAGRYVRLNVTTPSSNGNTAARIYELEVLGTVGAPPPPPQINLALNHPATSSTPCGAAEGPAKAFNGTWNGGTSDKWCAKAAPRWLQVDLGAVSTISSFVIHHASGGGEAATANTKDFTIQVSSDGATWTTPVIVTGNTAGVSTHPVATGGRYVRLNITTPAQNVDPAARIYEMQVMGTGGAPPPPPPPTPTNLALRKTATSSTPCGAAEGPDKAVNGTWTAGTSDKWCGKVAPRWLQVDLGAESAISSFVIHHASGGGEAATANTKDFTIRVSSDGVSWTTAVTVTANTAGVTTHPVTVSGRYVRLNITTPAQNVDPAARVYELEVMGIPA